MNGTEELFGQFKINIHPNGNIKITIPESANEYEKILFTTRCELIKHYFIENPFKTVLRGSIKNPLDNIILRTNHKQFKKFIIVGLRVHQYIHKKGDDDE